MSYAAYRAGVGTETALQGKREYMAERRASGAETTHGYAEPSVLSYGEGTVTVLVTARQAEILDKLREGAITASIARDLGVTAETVRRRIWTCYTALDFESRAELVRALNTGKLKYKAQR